MRESDSKPHGIIAGEIAIDPSPTAPKLGTTVLGKFKLLEILKSSPCSTIYKAEQLAQSRPVIVKVIHAEWTQGPRGRTARRCIEEERQLLANVIHPNLVSVLDTGDTPHGLPAIAMEYVEGRSLEDELSEPTAQLPPHLVIAYFEQLGSALKALHEAGVVHRSLSPSNIIIRATRCAEPKVTLLDPGTAALHDRVLTKSVADASRRYAAPEQILGNASERSDIYSLGAILWWALTGTELDEHFTNLSLARAWGEDLDFSPDPRSRRPELPEALSMFVARMLASNSEVRPTAAEFVAHWPDLAADLEQVDAPTWDDDSGEDTAPWPAPRRSQNAELGTPEWLPPVPTPNPELSAAGLTLPHDEFDPAPRRRTLRAAVLDHNAFTRQFVEAYLGRHEVTVERIDSPEAIPAAIDAVLVSGHAGSDPCSLVARIKTLRSDLPVILTAQYDIGDRWRTCGARELVIVPGSLARLGHLLEELREQSEHRPEPEVIATVDAAVIYAIAAEDTRLMLDTIEHFVGQFPEWLARLESCVETRDTRGCTEICRDIEAAVVMVGARSLTDAVKPIAELAATGRWEPIASLLERLEQAYGQVFKRLIEIRLELEAGQ